MPRVKVFDAGVNVWISANETEEWAAGRAPFSLGAWRSSELRGHRVFAQFDSNGIIDIAVDGREANVPADELNALVSAALKDRLPTEHPCRFVVVDQFLR